MRQNVGAGQVLSGGYEPLSRRTFDPAEFEAEVCRSMTESVWQTHVLQAAEATGWQATHFRPAWTQKGYRTPIQGAKGFPDTVLVNYGRLGFVECKRESGEPDANQVGWLDYLASVKAPGLFIAIWRPSDRDPMLAFLSGESDECPGLWPASRYPKPKRARARNA